SEARAKMDLSYHDGRCSWNSPTRACYEEPVRGRHQFVNRCAMCRRTIYAAGDLTVPFEARVEKIYLRVRELTRKSVEKASNYWIRGTFNEDNSAAPSKARLEGRVSPRSESLLRDLARIVSRAGTAATTTRDE